MYVPISPSFLFRRIFHSGFKYRDRANIVGDILDTVNSDPRGKTKTSIMRSANLSLDQTNKYIALLMVSGVIKPVEPLKTQESARYRLTDKGLKFAREFETWRYIFESYRKLV